MLIIDAIWSYFGNVLFQKLSGKNKTFLIYRNAVDRGQIGSIYGKMIEQVYEVSDEMQFHGTFDEIRGKLEGYNSL